MLLLDVQSIVRQALEHSPAYGTIKDVLDNLKADEVRLVASIDAIGILLFFFVKKSAEEQKDFLNPVLGNILKMTIRTLSNKRTKKHPEILPQVSRIR